MGKTMEEHNKARAPRFDGYVVRASETKVIEGFNIRTDYGDLSELVEIFVSTPEKIPPAKCYKKDGVYIITDGHRRRQAAILAEEVTKKPVMLRLLVEAKGYNDLERVTDMFLFNEGKKLTLLEQAEGIRRFAELYGLDEHAIAKRIHKSVTYVRNCIKLKTAPADIQQLMADEYVSPTLVISMFKEHDLDEAVQIIRDTVYGNKAEAPERKNQMAIDFQEEAAVVFPSGNEETESDNGGSRLNISSETVYAPEVDTEPKPTPRKITQKDINDNLKKENSIGHFKKVIKRSEQEPVNEEKADEFMFIQRLIMGEVNEKELARRYFNGKVVDTENF